MPIQMQEDGDRPVQTIQVTGTLVRADYGEFVPEFEQRVRERGKLLILFDITGLKGWEMGAMWDELKFDYKHFSDIERVAVLGDKKWEHWMTAFCAPFTKAVMRYFDCSELETAKAWLSLESSNVAP